MGKQQGKQARNIILGVVSVFIIIATIAVLVKEKSDYTSFAECLADEGYIMGGTSWCSHCKAQKAEFNGAFEEVIIPAGAYKDCDVDKVWCEENGIRGYPTWITPEGNLLEGRQELETLARISGCGLE